MLKFSLRGLQRSKCCLHHILVICLTVVLKVAMTVLISLYFWTFWPKWLNFLQSFQKRFGLWPKKQPEAASIPWVFVVSEQMNRSWLYKRLWCLLFNLKHATVFLTMAFMYFTIHHDQCALLQRGWRAEFMQPYLIWKWSRKLWWISPCKFSLCLVFAHREHKITALRVTCIKSALLRVFFWHKLVSLFFTSLGWVVTKVALLCSLI